MATASTSARPDAHTQKYDRQLRLWAAAGQTALETSNLLVINGGSATAGSTLKNLVLAGIGGFAIQDDTTVTEADIGNNFFLTPESLGKSRAEEVTKWVGELNEDVKGTPLNTDLASLVKSPDALAAYSLIIAVNADPTLVPQLAEEAWKARIPLIKVVTCGFYASVRVQVEELCIVETHPESLVDLRISHPFAELEAYATKFTYEGMSSMDHSHVPAVVILVKAMAEWRAAHGGQPPKGFAERKEFVEGIEKLKTEPDEENFDEAKALFRRAGEKPPVPEDIAPLFTDPSCTSPTASTPDFWLLVSALSSFVSLPSAEGGGGGLLPLSGVLPDMKSSTGGYVDLQLAYRAKARKDLAKFSELVDSLLVSLGRSANDIGQSERETFVKHSAFLKVIRGTSLAQEKAQRALKGAVAELQQDAEYSEINPEGLEIYLALQASEAFFATHGRMPGAVDGTWEEDVPQLQKLIGEFLATLGGGEMTESMENVAEEVCRAGASDLPQIAALIGGIVAQEATKLVTRQYVPLKETCVWNGIKSTMKVLKT